MRIFIVFVVDYKSKSNKSHNPSEWFNEKLYSVSSGGSMDRKRLKASKSTMKKSYFKFHQRKNISSKLILKNLLLLKLFVHVLIVLATHKLCQSWISWCYTIKIFNARPWEFSAGITDLVNVFNNFYFGLKCKHNDNIRCYFQSVWRLC